MFAVLQLEGVSLVDLTKCHSLMLFVSFSTEKGRYYFRDKPAHSSETPPACSAESVNHLLAGCGKKKKKNLPAVKFRLSFEWPSMYVYFF